MHTEHISRVITEATDKVMEGEITPETAKSVADLTRTEIANWRARLEYARHTGKVASISELEPSKLRKAA
jgi:hypothetical protein